MRYASIDSDSLLSQLAIVVRHARRANTRRVADHFATIAADMHAILESRTMLRDTVAAMLSTVPSMEPDALAVAASLYGCAYDATRQSNNGDNGSGGCKVRRRKPKPNPPSDFSAVPELSHGRI